VATGHNNLKEQMKPMGLEAGFWTTQVAEYIAIEIFVPTASILEHDDFEQSFLSTMMMLGDNDP
jgi:hypothetical protein